MIKGTQINASKFFKRDIASHEVYLNFENSNDSEFLAIAAGFIDLFLSKKLTTKFNKVYGALLEQYFNYFPQLLPQLLARAKPYEYLQCMVDTMNIADLISTIAYVLRQLTVDTIIKKPQLYPELFAVLEPHISPQHMRSPQQQLPYHCIAATAEVLKITINVELCPDNNNLPVKTSYNYKPQHSYHGCEIDIKLTAG